MASQVEVYFVPFTVFLFIFGNDRSENVPERRMFPGFVWNGDGKQYSFQWPDRPAQPAWLVGCCEIPDSGPPFLTDYALTSERRYLKFYKLRFLCFKDDVFHFVFQCRAGRPDEGERDGSTTPAPSSTRTPHSYPQMRGLLVATLSDG